MRLFFLFMATLVSGILMANEVKLTASDSETDDFFGRSVAISGDHVIVGAPQENAYIGSAYIYNRNLGGTNNWGEVKKLVMSDPVPTAEFGFEVSISGDYAIVGAERAQNASSVMTGAAYIFYRNQGGSDNWGELAKLVPSDGASGDFFGSWVVIEGDIAVVGAYNKNSQTGAAYVFYRNQGGANNWGEVKKLVASDAESGDSFGWDISISGDFIVVGASGEDSGGNGAGAAYLFSRNQGGADNWGEVKKLTASDADVLNSFGLSVSISGSFLAVGGFGGIVSSQRRGAVYIFSQNQGGSNNWGEVKKLFPSDTSTVTSFGWDVSLDGSYLIVSDDNNMISGPGQVGAIYGYLKNEGGTNNWGQVSKRLADSPETFSRHGFSISIDDGFAVVGAPFGDDGATLNTGAAYVYETLSDLSLPVSLNAFEVVPGNNEVVLKWSTASEINNEAFIVERALDGQVFTQIGEVPGQGNSNQQTDYQFADKAVRNGQRYYYRLADRDFSGVVTYHQVLSAIPSDNPDALPRNILLHPNYPNPFNPSTTIRVEIAGVIGTTSIDLEIFDISGRKVRTLALDEVSSGINEITWNGRDEYDRRLPSGVYFLNLRSAAYSQTQKLLLLE